MKFEQANVDSTIKFFTEGFHKRWNLKPYTEIEDPCVFFGIWNSVDLINKHKGLKIIILASSKDGEKLRYIDPKNLIVKNDVIQTGGKLIPIWSTFKIKQVDMEIKDYSIFKPNILGDKVYAYIGSSNRHGEFNYGNLLEVQKKINYEIMFAKAESLHHMVHINQLKQKFYDNCFVNLNFSQNTGMTTINELAYMGRYTIGNMPRIRGPLPSVINFVDLDNVVELINKEAQKIGTLQPSINNHTVNDEWLNVNYWFDNE
jgi:hypothetical protein